MTCKDCLYYEVCPLGLAIKGSTGTCLKFKNKADFVEVVRCKDCKHYDYGRCSKISYIMDGYYQGSFEVKKTNDFCSYGVKGSD